MTEAKILIVDDEASIRELLLATLTQAGFSVKAAEDGPSALIAAAAFEPDLIVLDVMMPGMNGYQVAANLKGVSYAPIIFLTARDTVDDKIAGFEAGSEDYLTKPFSLDELTARIRSVLRRTLGVKPPSTHLIFADIELDEDTRVVTKAGEVVSLSPTEFNLLRFFMRNPNKVLSKTQILESVWDEGFAGDVNVVESYVSYLRKKVDTSEPGLINTLRSVGYMLRRPPGMS